MVWGSKVLQDCKWLVTFRMVGIPWWEERKGWSPLMREEERLVSPDGRRGSAFLLLRSRFTPISKWNSTEVFFFLIRKSFNLTSVLLLYIKVNQAVLEESAVNWVNDNNDDGEDSWDVNVGCHADWAQSHQGDRHTLGSSARMLLERVSWGVKTYQTHSERGQHHPMGWSSRLKRESRGVCATFISLCSPVPRGERAAFHHPFLPWCTVSSNREPSYLKLPPFWDSL